MIEQLIFHGSQNLWAIVFGSLTLILVYFFGVNQE